MSNRKHLHRRSHPWLWLTPCLISLLLVAGWPLVRTAYFSLTSARLSSLSNAPFVGLLNYKLLLKDPVWWQSCWNTIWFTVVSVSIEMLLGLGFALALHANFKGRGIARAAILIPWAIPTIVSAKMWGWMYHDIYGVINELLIQIGAIKQGLPWLADSALAMWSVVIADVWKTTPFVTLILLAGLQTLPIECYEAAKIDGVSAWRVFWRVTLPLLRPALFIAIIFRALDALRIFDLIFVLTSNTPDTMSMSVYARQQLFDFQRVGQGSAASMMVFIAVMVIASIYLVLVRGSKESPKAI